MTTTNNTTSIEDIDAGYLAQFCANDLLTIVQPPDEEQDRDLLRSRQKVVQQRKHLQAVLRRNVRVLHNAWAG